MDALRPSDAWALACAALGVACLRTNAALTLYAVAGGLVALRVLAPPAAPQAGAASARHAMVPNPRHQAAPAAAADAPAAAPAGQAGPCPAGTCAGQHWAQAVRRRPPESHARLRRQLHADFGLGSE